MPQNPSFLGTLYVGFLKLFSLLTVKAVRVSKMLRNFWGNVNKACGIETMLKTFRKQHFFLRGKTRKKYGSHLSFSSFLLCLPFLSRKAKKAPKKSFGFLGLSSLFCHCSMWHSCFVIWLLLAALAFLDISFATCILGIL